MVKKNALSLNNNALIISLGKIIEEMIINMKYLFGF